MTTASVVLLLAGTALANTTPFGIRGGVTDDPDTFFFGGHLAIHPDRAPELRIEPSFELGFGDNYYNDDLVTIRGSLNFKYMLPVSRQAAFYPLFGPGLYYRNPDNGGSYTEFGLNLGFGFAFSGIGIDVILGLPDDDLPQLAFAFSYTFW